MTADGTTVAGQVWSFTTANWIVVQAGQVALNYNNTLDPFISQLAFDVPADLTKNGVTDLALRFQGQAAAQGRRSATTMPTGTYTVAAPAPISGATPISSPMPTRPSRAMAR